MSGSQNHVTNANAIAGSPSMRNIVRQSVHWISNALNVDPSAVEIGTATMNSATIRARSFCG